MTRAFDASFIVQAGHVEVRYADAGLIVCHCRSGRPSVRFETAAGEEKRCRVDDRSRRFQFDDGTGYQTQSFGKAKMAISRMVEKLSNDKIGLIVFAGDAYVQLPITTDYSSAKLFLSNISTDIVPVQGTAIGSAIDLAARSFTPETETSKAIIVITDGENHQDDAVAAAKQAHEKGIVIHTIGMGLEQGAPIPEKGKPGQFMQDAQGNVVISKLDEQTLQDIAKAGEGLYIRASNTEVGLNRLLDEVNRMEKSLLEERVYSDYAEKYQYFLLVGLFFIFVEFMILGRKNKHFMKINLFKR